MLEVHGAVLVVKSTLPEVGAVLCLFSFGDGLSVLLDFAAFGFLSIDEFQFNYLLVRFIDERLLVIFLQLFQICSVFLAVVIRPLHPKRAGR